MGSNNNHERNGSNNEKDRRGKPFVALMDLSPSPPTNEYPSDALLEKNQSQASLPNPKSLDVILTLNDPRDGQTRQYLSPKVPSCNGKDGEEDSSSPLLSTTSVKGRHVYEIQSMPHSTSPNYSSFFVGSQVLSNPSLQLISRVDPLFFLLNYFSPMISSETKKKNEDTTSTSTSGKEENGTNEKGHYKWQPWNQICQSNQIPPIILQALLASSSVKKNKDLDKNNTNCTTTTTTSPPLQLNHLFQINDTLGPDMILYKFHLPKVMKWLLAKLNRIEAGLDLVQPPKDNDASGNTNDSKNGGAFASSFVVSNRHVSTPSSDKMETMGGGGSSTSDQEPSSKNPNPNCIAALHILCEYLSPTWTNAFLSHCKANKMGDVVYASGMDMESVTHKQTQGQQTKYSSSPQIVNTDDDSMPPRRTVVTPPPPQSTRVSSESTLTEADKLLQYTMGGGGKQSQDGNLGRSPSSSGSNTQTMEKRNLNSSKSMGLKRLEKVNTKGMKSLTSFFGGGKKGTSASQKNAKKRKTY